MSTMTTTVRGTPSLTVAPTQNTAPVFEFRCLFTYDLRKKKKIWHDGSLRFHTFNRRVMVYDDLKNYIGDAHWRETGEFLEGEELRLDKGVMVEVGEQIGHTETDLAPIIRNKRRLEITSSPPRVPLPSNPMTSAPRLVGTVPQARPKSLAAVLGASQGRIGRARLPSRSPFEQRQDNVQRLPETYEDRATKRPRIAANRADKENRIQNPAPAGPAQSPTADASRRVHDTRINLPSQKKSFMSSNRNLETSAGSFVPPLSALSHHGGERKAREQPTPIPKAEIRRNPCPSRSTTTSGSVQKKDGESFLSSLISDQTSKQNTTAYSPTVPTRNSNHTRVPADDATGSTRQLGGPVTTKLCFKNEKPRKKLIYTDLLLRPGQDKRPRLADDNRYAQKERNNGRAAGELQNTRENMPTDTLIIDLLNEDEDDVPTTGKTHVSAHMETALKGTPSLVPSPLSSSSPLFVNELSYSTSFEPSQLSVCEDFAPLQCPELPSQKSFDKPLAEELHRSEISSRRDTGNLEHTHEIGDEATEVDPLPRMPSNLTLLDQRLLHTSAVAELHSKGACVQSPLKQRQFRRILSESDSYTHCRPEVSPVEFPREPACTTTASVPHGANPGQKASRSPTRVQRSISDVTHLAQTTEVPQRTAAITPAVEACFEPWSEPEAYLLFDWWPSGREKPFFVMDES
ncbi:hypothetical protein GJ744_010869 [Endocarpon pusillum]|uniref:5'-3' DNA helicase ZGRF1-like N-terminal domain-containing protein n=1 Tax=Endocarpon pusillum TaxID=364733 RepID=A0A8H7AHN4_9EURO|nr:hypothetical protein GJ744_010869 [Endocarpon pusillum]